MLTMKDTGLVEGVPLARTPGTSIKVRRGFTDENGKACAPGQIVQVSERFARSVIAAGKAERAEAPKVEPAPIEEPPEPAPLQAEPATPRKRTEAQKQAEREAKRNKLKAP